MSAARWPTPASGPTGPGAGLFDAHVGQAPVRAAYSALWIPDQPVAGQHTNLGVLREDHAEPAGEVETRFVDLTLARELTRGGVIARTIVVFLVATAFVLGLMTLDFCAPFFGSPTALLPIYASAILRVGPQGLGLLVSATSVGAVTGVLFSGRLRRIHRQGAGVFG